MRYTLSYHPYVVKQDIPTLSTANKKRIRTAIEAKLTEQPEVFGIPLRHSKKGDRRLRVGAFRVIFRIVGKEVKIYLIEHRSVVYTLLDKRT